MDVTKTYYFYISYCNFIYILGAKPPEESGSGHFACEEDPCRFGGLCDYDSEGQPQCVCPFECPAIRAPVCGSDGNFYDSDCHMKEQACKLQKKIVIVPRNRCQSKTKLYRCNFAFYVCIEIIVITLHYPGCLHIYASFIKLSLINSKFSSNKF